MWRLFSLTLIALLSCDVNFYEPLATKDSDKVLLEKARVHMDNQEYSKALETLESMEGQSNERSILTASATIGEAGLSLLTVVLTLLETAGDSFSGDDFLNGLSDSVFGDTQASIDQKVGALERAIDELVRAPNGDDPKLANLSCFLAGILAVPSITEGQSALADANSTLTSIGSSASGGGNDASQCPDLDLLSEQLNEVQQVINNFTLILEQVSDCGIIDLSSATGDLNSVEANLVQFKEAADKGCEPVPDCGGNPACEALNLGCVQSAVTTDAVAGDGIISQCEFLQNCLTDTCF